MTTALLIIDVQQSLCFGEFAAFEAERVIDRINQVSALGRSAGIPVVVIQHETPDGPLKFGEPGWQTAAGLVVAPADIRLRKRTPDSFHNTELQAILSERHVSSLIVCGLQSDFCVDTTVRRALALGYPVTLVSDGHSTVDNGVLKASQISAHHNATLSSITSFGPRARVSPASEIRITA
jgi:nicotinamidase-related amidase